MSKQKLLLADDSVTIQKVVNLTFADEEIEVFTVGDGDAAMQKISEVEPDLILADVNMPGLDGYQICEAVKQSERIKEVPVVLLVGSFEPFDEAKAREVGADDFLVKPFQSIRLLISKVSDLLESKNNSASAIAGSFENTLKTKSHEESDTAENSDAKTDDEAVQIFQIDDFSIEESPAAEIISQSFAEEVDRNALKSPYNSENVKNIPAEEDWAKTQPFSKEDIYEIEANLSEAETVSNLELDESDLLDFPQVPDGENFSENILFDDSEIGIKTSGESENQISETSDIEELPVKEKEESKDFAPTENVSTELIDAIADRIIEKLSNQFIKRVVRETIAQMERKK